MTISDLIDAYLAGIDSLRRAVGGLSLEQLRDRPGPGAWSALEVVCHVADSEGLFAERMKRVLVEERPPLPFADPARYLSALAYEQRDVDEELEYIACVRRQMSRILRSQPPDAWRRAGIHSNEGDQTLEQLLRKAVGHLQHHLGFIREKRRALEQVDDPADG